MRTQETRKKTRHGESMCYHEDMDLTKSKTPVITARVLVFKENNIIIQRKAMEENDIRDCKP